MSLGHNFIYMWEKKPEKVTENDCHDFATKKATHFQRQGRDLANTKTELGQF